ncbi:MAG: hypothetical protein KA200_00065 [Burkholderiales bacterium]|nr:hypothetical protein [Burkholderiales bacterium]
MFANLLMPIIRHALTTLGGAVAGTGLATESDIQSGVGAVMTLIGLGLSVWNAVRGRQGA